MARPKKTFEQYILQEDAHSRKYVNQESYLRGCKKSCVFGK